MYARTLILLLPCLSLLSPQTAQSPGQDQQQEKAEKTRVLSLKDSIRALYTAVSFPPGGACDWDALKKLMHEKATIAMPPHAGRILTRAGFFKDFENFIARTKVKTTGFYERPAAIHVQEFGSIAHAMVVYEARLDKNSEKPRQRGVDSINYVRTATGWRITSIVTEVERPSRPIPAFLLPKKKRRKGE